jgi:hypothetical protein
MSLLIELHEAKLPFAVIISHEITGTNYSVIYQDRLIRSKEMIGAEINYFLNIRKQMKLISTQGIGSVWEYNNFRLKMPHSLKYNYLIRNQITKNS